MAQLKIDGQPETDSRIPVPETGTLDLAAALSSEKPKAMAQKAEAQKAAKGEGQKLTLRRSGHFYILDASPPVAVNGDFVANTVVSHGDSIKVGPKTLRFFEQESQGQAGAGSIGERAAQSPAGSIHLDFAAPEPEQAHRREDSTLRSSASMGADDLWFSLCRTFSGPSALWLAYDPTASEGAALRSYPFGPTISIHPSLLTEAESRGVGVRHHYPEGAVTARPLKVDREFYGWLVTKECEEPPYPQEVLKVSRAQEPRAKERAKDLAAQLLSQWSHGERLNRQIPQHFTKTLTVLIAMLEAKDTYTAGHSKRVGDMAAAFGPFLGLSPSICRQLANCGALHDIGKIAIPDHILKKPNPLTPEEFQEMKLHPVIGAAILRRLPGCRSICPGIRHHHEKWDGSGYPDGLKGEQIPFFARIVAVIDCFDALVSGRTYSGFVEEPKALQILSDESHLFDPKLLTAFIAFRKAATLTKGQSHVR